MIPKEKRGGKSMAAFEELDIHNMNKTQAIGEQAGVRLLEEA